MLLVELQSSSRFPLWHVEQLAIHDLRHVRCAKAQNSNRTANWSLAQFLYKHEAKRLKGRFRGIRLNSPFMLGFPESSSAEPGVYTRVHTSVSHNRMLVHVKQPQNTSNLGKLELVLALATRLPRKGEASGGRGGANSPLALFGGARSWRAGVVMHIFPVASLNLMPAQHAGHADSR